MDQIPHKRYWKRLEEQESCTGLPYAAGEEPTADASTHQSSLNRRQFLGAVGFSLAAVGISSCSRVPEEKIVSYVNHPEGIVPGVAEFYASTCGACTAGCGMLVKTREGRPVKLEGNPDHPLSVGSLCAVGQASVMGIYDSHRLTSPMASGSKSTWDGIDSEIIAKLEEARRSGGAVRFLSGSILSPTAKSMIDRFLGTFPDARHVSYDAISHSAILDSHTRTHRTRVLPRYFPGKAKTIVSFDADFLGTWISPVEHAAGYGRGRKPEGDPPTMSYHCQFESIMSVSGSNADKRVRVSPAELGLAIGNLATRIAAKAGGFNSIARMAFAAPKSITGAELDELADRLWMHHEHGEHSLILCGSQNEDHQVACNFINHALGNYGSTLDLAQPSLQRQGNDRELASLINELNSGSVSVLLMHGVNPVYNLPEGATLKAAIQKIPLTVSFSDHEDETSQAAKYICPDHHQLESWGDVEAVSGLVSLVQPSVSPIGNTRALIESLSAWLGETQSAFEILQQNWAANIFPKRQMHGTFQEFWDHSLHDGFAELSTVPIHIGDPKFTSLPLDPPTGSTGAGSLSLVLHAKVGMLDGSHANNPWLQELPDPITKVTWDNHASFSPATAARLGIALGDVVSLDISGSGQIELPALIQPGQHDDVVAVALGYGGEATKRFANVGYQWLEAKPTLGNNGLVGVNAAPFLEFNNGQLNYQKSGVTVTKTGKRHSLAASQDYHFITVPEKFSEKFPGLERRPVIQETTLAEYIHDPKAGSHHGHIKLEKDLWPDDHPYKGHHWGLSVDLNKCTGCSACVIACQVENNIPVVGKDEVARNRDLHWIRIDRYYEGEADNVNVVHQPMMCQQCDNAPCETVCPVLATVHSSEGLNQQIYNRCVGTRYCANNCPYKTRRFNWFNYAHNDKLQNLVLNPDVTVRSRGVMEKCTFCVQRIQETKTLAKLRGTELQDGEITPACQQTCPSKAIVFGDMNNEQSEVYANKHEDRAFRVLEEVNVKPSVYYQTLVRNRKAGSGGGQHG